MQHIADASCGLGLILELALDRLLFPAAIGISLAVGGAIMTL